MWLEEGGLEEGEVEVWLEEEEEEEEEEEGEGGGGVSGVCGWWCG